MREDSEIDAGNNDDKIAVAQDADSQKKKSSSNINNVVI